MASSQSRILRGSIWSLIGNGIPLLAAMYSIPQLIDVFGFERFAVLTLAWAVSGYFSFLDLGLGRATTTLLSRSLQRGRARLSIDIVSTSTLLVSALGVAAGVVAGIVSLAMVIPHSGMSSELREEAYVAFVWVSLSVPFVLLNSLQRGVLEAHQRFATLSVIRGVIGSMSFVGPLFGAVYFDSLPVAAGALFFSRLMTFLALQRMLSKEITRCRLFEMKLRKRLALLSLRYGGWSTVSNVVSPMMTYLDRFYLSAFASLSSVTAYVAPYEAATRLWIIPSSVSAALLPNAAAAKAKNSDLPALTNYSISIVCAVLLPLVVFGILFADQLLRLWLKDNLVAESGTIIRLLLVGVFINSIAQIPFVGIQAVGRPDVTAKLHLIELPLYCLALFIGVKFYGLLGVAGVWVLRCVVDAVAIAIAASILGVLRARLNTEFLAFASVGGTLLLLSLMLPDGSRSLGLILILGSLIWSLALAARLFHFRRAQILSQ